jgi:dihydroorotate dehydrogenase (fumarate)
MDLSTTYLGIRLPSPLIVGAGPLADEADGARALEDAGASMIVLRSLFEEEVVGEQMDAFRFLDGHGESFAEASGFSPEADATLGPDEYLEHIHAIKTAVRVPVVASLCGMTRTGWISYSRMIEDAGADALELHLYHPASDMETPASEVERHFVDLVRDVKRSLRIPVAVKLAPLFTAFSHFAKQVDDAGADGLVLFTRFNRVDIDVDELEVIRTRQLSDPSELTMRLRGAAALSGRVRASIALSGGVHSGLEVIKATMAGAHGTQLVSALLRNGPDYLRIVRNEIEVWMQEHEWASLNEMRGNMSLGKIPDPAAYERANFRMALR